MMSGLSLEVSNDNSVIFGKTLRALRCRTESEAFEWEEPLAASTDDVGEADGDRGRAAGPGF